MVSSPSRSHSSYSLTRAHKFSPVRVLADTGSDRRILRPDVDQWRKDIEAMYEAVKTGGEYYRNNPDLSLGSGSDSG